MVQHAGLGILLDKFGIFPAFNLLRVDLQQQQLAADWISCYQEGAGAGGKPPSYQSQDSINRNHADPDVSSRL